MNDLIQPTVQQTYTGNKYTWSLTILVLLMTKYWLATLRAGKKLTRCHMLLER